MPYYVITLFTYLAFTESGWNLNIMSTRLNFVVHTTQALLSLAMVLYWDSVVIRLFKKMDETIRACLSAYLNFFFTITLSNTYF